MSNKISTVLIGLGKIGFGYDFSDTGFKNGQTFTHLKALLESQTFSVDAIIDSDQIVLENVRDFVQIRGGTSLSSLPNIKNFDLLVLACPTTYHLQVLKDSIAIASFNFLLIEKPVGSNSLECLEIQNLTNNNNIEVFVNYFRRYLRTTREAKTFLNSVDKGAFQSAYIRSYGSLHNIFSHFIDLCLELSATCIFCPCSKIQLSNNPSAVAVICNQCVSQISIVGINDIKCNSEVVLNFEKVEIRITNNGFDIVVLDKYSKNQRQFRSTPYEIINYQEMVYSEILNVLGKPNSMSGLGQAISVHRFIESIYFAHD